MRSVSHQTHRFVSQDGIQHNFATIASSESDFSERDGATRRSSARNGGSDRKGGVLRSHGFGFGNSGSPVAHKAGLHHH